MFNVERNRFPFSVFTFQFVLLLREHEFLLPFAGFSCLGEVHLYGVCRLRRGHPHGNAVHPSGSRTEGGVHLVRTAGVGEPGAIEIALVSHLATNHPGDGGILDPTGRCHPDGGTRTKGMLYDADILGTIIEVLNFQLITAKRNNDIVGL